MHSLMAQGTRQHPQKQPTKAMTQPAIHAIKLGLFFVLVIASFRQDGQTRRVLFGPRGIIVVTICWAVKIGCCGVNGFAALHPLIA
jgi:hypothetical protein